MACAWRVRVHAHASASDGAVMHAPPLRELGGTALTALTQPPFLAHGDSELWEELIERALPPGVIDSGWWCALGSGTKAANPKPNPNQLVQVRANLRGTASEAS